MKSSLSTFSALPTSDSEPPAPVAEPLFPGFLRTSSTKCSYTWITSGRLSQICSDGGVTDGSGSIVDPVASLNLLIGRLETLEADGALNHGQINALGTKLEAAVKAWEEADLDQTRNSLGAFVNQVNALLNAEILSGEHGGLLVDDAVELMAALDGNS